MRRTAAPWLVALLAAAACALLVLPPLGQRILAASDEARFPLLARDMIRDGDWFTAQVRGRLYRNKPPLYPWAIALASWPGGAVTEATAQLPVALAAVAAASFTALLAARLFGPRAGLGAGLVLISTNGFFLHAQTLLPDMPMVACMTAATYAFWAAMDGGGPPRRAPLAAFHAALALGLFAKGPAGLLPILPAAAWLWTVARWRGLARLWSPAGAALFVAITLAWLAPYLSRGAGSYAASVVRDDWLGWYWGIPSPRDKADQVIDALVGLLPWTGPALLAAALAWRERAEPGVRYALLVAAVPTIAILLGQNTRVRYLLPLYPAAAILVGWWAERLTRPASRAARVIGVASAALAALFVAALAAPHRLLPKDDPVRLSPAEAVPLMVAGVLIGLYLLVGLWRARRDLLIWGVGALTVAALAYGIWPYNRRFNEAWDFRGLAARAERQAPGAPVAVFGGRWFGLDFYLGRDLRRLYTLKEFEAFVAQPGPRLVVANDKVWSAIRTQMAPGVHMQVLDRLRVGGQAMFILRRDRG